MLLQAHATQDLPHKPIDDWSYLQPAAWEVDWNSPCGYKSFKCPASVGCILMGSVSGISHHFQVKHAVKTVEVPSNEWVEILLEFTVDSADLLLKTVDMLFLFHHEEQLYGRVIYILSFVEASQENAYRYHAEVHLDETVFSMTTIAKSVWQPGKDQVASSLIIPDALLAGKIGIPICYHLYCAKEEEEEEYPISAKESDTKFSPIEDPIDLFDIIGYDHILPMMVSPS